MPQQVKPPKLYTSDGLYRLCVARLRPSFRSEYNRAWAAARALQERNGSGALVTAAIRLLAERLVRRCERRGIDWRQYLPPEDRDERLPALEAKRRRKPQVDE